MKSEAERTREQNRYAREAGVFDDLYPRVEKLLDEFGRPKYVPGAPAGDFAVHGDYSGRAQVVVFVNNLQMLRPAVVTALQDLVKEYPGWQIVMTVAVRGQIGKWPNMGIYIRPHEIIDGLQRQYFPREYQDIEYAGAARNGGRLVGSPQACLWKKLTQRGCDRRTYLSSDISIYFRSKAPGRLALI